MTPCTCDYCTRERETIGLLWRAAAALREKDTPEALTLAEGCEETARRAEQRLARVHQPPPPEAA